MPTNLIIGSGKTAKKSIQGGFLSSEMMERARANRIQRQILDRIDELKIRGDALDTKIDRIENIYTRDHTMQRDTSKAEETLNKLYSESESLETEIQNLANQYNDIQQYLNFEQPHLNVFNEPDPRAAAEEEQKEEPQTLQEEKDDHEFPTIPEDAEYAD
jgi:chromosome segregation ATPase